jgi:hypothetical protein
MAQWLAPVSSTVVAPQADDYYERFFVSRVVDKSGRQALEQNLQSLQQSGSWPADGDPWRLAGGRLYSTCFALLALRES